MWREIFWLDEREGDSVWFRIWIVEVVIVGFGRIEEKDDGRDVKIEKIFCLLKIEMWGEVIDGINWLFFVGCNW